MSGMFRVVVTGVDEAIDAAKAFEVQIAEAYDEGLRNCATALRNATRAELRKPGSGRLYPSRVGRTVRRQIDEVSARKRLLADPNRQDVRSSDRVKLKRSRKRLKRTIERLGSQGIRVDRKHRASAEGEPPAPDVGLLPQGVKAGVIDDTRVVGVGGEWEGWEALHEGRGRVRGKRPYFDLAIRRIEGRLPDILVKTIRERGVFDG